VGFQALESQQTPPPIKQEIKNKTACGVNIMSDGILHYNQILAE
jgi:hypothetical protein